MNERQNKKQKRVNPDINYVRRLNIPCHLHHTWEHYSAILQNIFITILPFCKMGDDSYTAPILHIVIIIQEPENLSIIKIIIPKGKKGPQQPFCLSWRSFVPNINIGRGKLTPYMNESSPPLCNTYNTTLPIDQIITKCTKFSLWILVDSQAIHPKVQYFMLKYEEKNRFGLSLIFIVV